MALYPIWKDYYVIIGDQDKVDFSIYVVLSGTRTTIYQGTAYRKPGDSSIRIRINDICADWLAENLGLLDDATLNNTEMPLTFIVSHGTGEVSVQFVNDWSYDYARNVGTDGMSAPIDGRVYWDMPLPFTSLDEGLALIAYMKDGTPRDATVTAADIPEDCKDTDLGRALRTSGCFTALLGDIKIEPAGAAFDFTDLASLNPPQESGTSFTGAKDPSTEPFARILPSNLSVGSFDDTGKTALLLISGTPMMIDAVSAAIDSVVITCNDNESAASLKSSLGTLSVQDNIVTVTGISGSSVVVRRSELGTANILKIEVKFASVLTPFSELEAIEVQSTGATYRFVDTCARYALYYVNAYGGWDTLVMDGTDMEQDELTRHEATRVYDNNSIQNRGTVNHVNEIQKSWTLHTGYLTDEQSGRMHHLLNSVQVYLYDMESGTFVPVVLDGTTTEYRTYRNQGRRLVSYEVRARLAQTRMRR